MHTETQEQVKSALNLTKFAAEVHAGNKKRGFWDNYLALDGLLCSEGLKTDIKSAHVSRFIFLVNSELMEAEAAKQCASTDAALFLNDESAFDPALFKTHIKDTFEDEIADAFIRILDLCAAIFPEKSIVIDNHPNPVHNYRYRNLSAVMETMHMVNLAHEVMRNRGNDSLFDGLVNCLNFLSREFGGFLWNHINWKLKYNETRPFMHGKKF